MRYGSIWKTIGMIDRVGLFLLGIGIIAGDIAGAGLASLGAAVIVGATAGRFVRALWIGIMAGTAVGYIVGGMWGACIGAVVGGIVGSSIGWGMYKWTVKKREEMDASLESAQSIFDMERETTLKKMNIIDSMMKSSGSGIIEKGPYRKEMSYIMERINNIRYDRNSTRSLENAASSYLDLTGDLDRLKQEIGRRGGFEESAEWSISDDKRYSDEDSLSPFRSKKLDAKRYSDIFGAKKRKRERKKREKPDSSEENERIKPSRSYARSLRKPTGSKVSERIRRSLPNYEINLHIHSGSSADVYFGNDLEDREIVIKVPRTRKEMERDLSTLAEFMSNTKLWKELKHENIVEIFESDVQPAPHIAMERMEGGNLDGLMKNHRLSIEETMHIILQLLKGVSYAHKKAAVHRGIKPNNIMFDRNGNPKISDWGWEKFVAKTNPTRRKKKSGMLAYRAPEQIDPKRFGKSSIAIDIFQLGTILYEMLTGQNPFFSEDPHEITKNITDREPEPPSKLNDEIPPELDFIVMRAVEKHREDRWESVEEMYRKLLEISDTEMDH